MSFAPLDTARLTRNASTGWVSVVLVPVAKMSLAFSNSAMELVIAPRPTMTAIPAIVGACQVREQLSMLLVPMTARASFCMRKLPSLGARAELHRAKALGPDSALTV